MNQADADARRDWQLERPEPEAPPTPDLVDDVTRVGRPCTNGCRASQAEGWPCSCHNAQLETCTCDPDPVARARSRNHTCTIHPPF